MQTPCLLGFWDVITSSLMDLFPTVNKALKQNLPLASFVKLWTGSFHYSSLGISSVVSQLKANGSSRHERGHDECMWFLQSRAPLRAVVPFTYSFFPHCDPLAWSLVFILFPTPHFPSISRCHSFLASTYVLHPPSS